MANKSTLRVQVSLRRVVNFKDEQPEHGDKSPADEKATVQSSKAAKAQRA